MNATLAVMTRELVAKREIVVVAVAAAIIAGVMPLMPGLDSYQPDDIRTVSANTLAVALGWGLALLFGATMIGGDLSEGRLGFFFARPVSGLAVWWGRILAVLLLIFVCEAIVLVPSLFGDGVSVLMSSRGWGWPAVIGYLVMPLLLLLLAHAVSVMVRARTAWLFLDLAAIVVAGIVVWLTVRPFIELTAEMALWVIGGLLVAALVLALVVGGASGLVIGRIDLQRTHGAQSLGMWFVLALGLGGVVAYANWLRDFEPPQFSDVEVMAVAPDGQWVEVFGRAENRLDVWRRCLVSSAGHRWLTLPGYGLGFPREVLFSLDGSTGLWFGKGRGDDPRPLWWADLRLPSPEPRESTIVVHPRTALAMAPDGSRVAALEDGMLSIYELGSEKLITAVRLPIGLRRATIFCASRDTVRLYARSGEDDPTIRIAEVDVESGDVVPTGEVAQLAEKTWLAIDGELDHLVVPSRLTGDGSPGKSIHDATDGTFIRSYELTGFPRFLRDGRLVTLTESEGGQAQLVVESIENGDRIVHELEPADGLTLSGEAQPNRVVVSRLADPADRTQGLRIDLIDVDTGDVQNIGMRLRRAFPWLSWQWGAGGSAIWYVAEPEASRFFLDKRGALVRWDPETGKLIHVVGGRD